MQVSVHFMHLFMVELVLSWDLKLQSSLALLAFWNTLVLERNEIVAELSMEVSWEFMAFVMPHQFEFEAANIFVALSVIAHDSHFGNFAQIVLVLVEENL